MKTSIKLLILGCWLAYVISSFWALAYFANNVSEQQKWMGYPIVFTWVIVFGVSAVPVVYFTLFKD